MEVVLRSIVNYFETVSPGSTKNVPDDPKMMLIFIVLSSLTILLVIVVYFLVVWACLRISRKVFRSLEKKYGRKIHLQFAESIIGIFIVVMFIIVPLAGDQIRQSILGSAAVVAAIVGIACQDIIKDTLSGLMISIYKPFDLGDRIELEDGTAGVVESITMRHVVLVLVDTVRLVIPNSKLNTSLIRNYSFDYVPRSAQFTFPVAYDTDIARAKEVIYEAIEQSSYSVPGKKDKAGNSCYGSVYFISLSDSAFMMKVTVYFEPETPTEVLKDDINTRVAEALAQNGIEIPYNYTNVIMKQEG